MWFTARDMILIMCSMLGTHAASLSDLTNFGIDIYDSLPLTDFGIGEVVYSSILDFVGYYNCNFYEDVDYDLSQLKLCHYNFDSEQVDTILYNLTDGAGQLFLDMSPDAANYSYHIYIPGFNSGPNATSWSAMRQAYQSLNNSNIKYFALDHTEYTSIDSLPLISYDKAVTYTYHIGKQMGIYLSELVLNYSIPIENIYVVGHSLGAQMSGVTGNHVQNLTGHSLPRITGLDPAAPCFSDQPLKYVIDSSDADYVDIMHCNAGGFGWTDIYGSADFYPNGGKTQPACKAIKIFLYYNEAVSACSHSICPVYFALSLLQPLDGQLCDSYQDYTDEQCEANVVAVTGLQYNATINGTYYLTIEE